MASENTAGSQVSPAHKTVSAKEAAVVVTAHALEIGDKLTVVSGGIDGAWTVEDESGAVYRATPVE